MNWKEEESSDIEEECEWLKRYDDHGLKSLQKPRWSGCRLQQMSLERYQSVEQMPCLRSVRKDEAREREDVANPTELPMTRRRSQEVSVLLLLVLRDVLLLGRESLNQSIVRKDE